ncbi:AbrB/MazE/SpoVT family DNA-binding domain-containing protein [Gloeocapsa sp. PCC 73106]|uniref:AbrB/MazE/SpoVT family DNA-binding domain-containing protein n=1 Tax=Gloeocapsa sp. PCC 73106 TaxID=102232 RepID=UPI0002AC8134|nr:AbrB/MazE/SpoVT family DNA-binding domain-containing protein [Gloeocapsa sp. PCC 73106]ELR98762.1 looped-hinge helix DNA binding domain, AbrB family [Gloeocapsa sp. PCC 73106]
MEATVTTKGQITLPKALREAMHLKTGDKVLFEPLEDGTYVIKPRATDIKSLKGCVGYQGKPKTLEEIDAAIEEEAGFEL